MAKTTAVEQKFIKALEEMRDFLVNKDVMPKKLAKTVTIALDAAKETVNNG
jgi:molybdate-binding protein